jgi:hypothetical protein
MASFSDEISFLEQQVELLKKGALQEALQMTSVRLQTLKSSLDSAAFDPKVCVCSLAISLKCKPTRMAIAIAQHPPGFR